MLKKLVFLKTEMFYLVASQVLYTFLATLLLVVGYLVTPTLFASLDSKLAGDIAGVLFVISGYVTLFVLLLILLWQFWLKLGLRSYWPNVVAIPTMATLLFIISPWMSEIKQSYPLGLTKDSADWSTFAALHGIYQLAYLFVIIMLIFLMLKSVQRTQLLLNKG